MEEKIDISIIVPAFNTEKYIERCILSIENQDLESIEIICIDDHSSDGTLRLLQEMKRKYNNIIVVSNVENKGLSYSRNVGIKIAKGNYILFVDSDDWIESNSLKNLLQHAEKDDLDILFFEYVQEYENDQDYTVFSSAYNPSMFIDEHVYTGEEMFVNFGRFNSHRCMSVISLYRSDYLRDNNICFFEGILHEDVLFYPSVMIDAKRTKYVNIVVYHYFRHMGTIMNGDIITQKRLFGLIIVCAELYKMIKEKKLGRRCTDELIRYLNSERNTVRLWYKKLIFDEVVQSFQFEKIDYYLEFKNDVSDINNRLSYILTAKKINNIKMCSDIIVYGAGKIAESVIQDLHENGIDDFYIAVSNVEQNKLFYGNPIKQIEDYSDIKETAAVIIAVSQKYQAEIINNLNTLGFKNIV